MRTKGTASQLEAIRRKAVQCVLQGKTQAQVARLLSVHPVTVAKWMAQQRASGPAGLAARPTPGRPRLLSPKQEQQVYAWLADKPTAHGFATDLWTARRVAALIQRRSACAFIPTTSARG